MGRSFLGGLIKDLMFAAATVAIVALVVYALAGTWPAMVAVESDSMVPHIYRGDIVFIQTPDRTDIITYQQGVEIGYKAFENYGDVIVYIPNGDPNTMPIIHRVMYWADAGDKMPNGGVAQHAGYITKGDANHNYDQPNLSGPVKPEWIVGVAWGRLPYLGYVRLMFDVNVGLFSITT